MLTTDNTLSHISKFSSKASKASSIKGLKKATDCEDHRIVEKFRKLVKQSKPAIFYNLNFLANVLNKSIKGI